MTSPEKIQGSYAYAIARAGTAEAASFNIAAVRRSAELAVRFALDGYYGGQRDPVIAKACLSKIPVKCRCIPKTEPQPDKPAGLSYKLMFCLSKTHL